MKNSFFLISWLQRLRRILQPKVRNLWSQAIFYLNLKTTSILCQWWRLLISLSRLAVLQFQPRHHPYIGNEVELLIFIVLKLHKIILIWCTCIFCHRRTQPQFDPSFRDSRLALSPNTRSLPIPIAQRTCSLDRYSSSETNLNTSPYYHDQFSRPGSAPGLMYGNELLHLLSFCIVNEKSTPL